MQRVLVTGGTGFIGRALIRELIRRGDQVTVLTRNVKKARAAIPRHDVRVVRWDPDGGGPWEDELGVVDAVVHFAGANVVKRWTARYRDEIKKSRGGAARVLVDAIGKHDHKPAVFVSASGTGFYGSDRPGREFDEKDGPGDDFLAGICIDWEDAAKGVEDHGVRSVQLRIGMVVGAGGGAVDGMVQLGGAFVGGPIGKGDNVVSWVHIDDVVGMALMAIDDATIRGPINVTSPYVSTGREIARAMASVLGRPAVGMPSAVAKAIFGDVIDAVVGSLSVRPQRALELGYEYHFPRLVPALEEALIRD